MGFVVGDRIIVNDPVDIFYDGKAAVVEAVFDDYVAIGGAVVYKVSVGNVEFMLREEKMKAAA